jgi:hypothetical protein
MFLRNHAWLVALGSAILLAFPGTGRGQTPEGTGTVHRASDHQPKMPEAESSALKATPDATDQTTARPASRKDSAVAINTLTGLGMISARDYTPLTGKQRWQYYLNQNFMSSGAFFGPVLLSTVDQIGNQPPEWGGGMKGYGQRLASRFGTSVVQGSAQSLGCALLHQEPRYIRSADSGALKRVGHAFLYTLITYNNDGKKRPALASLTSYYVSAFAADAWLPSRYTIAGDAVRDGNRTVIFAALINQMQEFWPEIRRYVFRRK